MADNELFKSNNTNSFTMKLMTGKLIQAYRNQNE